MAFFQTGSTSLPTIFGLPVNETFWLPAFAVPDHSSAKHTMPDTGTLVNTQTTTGWAHHLPVSCTGHASDILALQGICTDMGNNYFRGWSCSGTVSTGLWCGWPGVTCYNGVVIGLNLGFIAWDGGSQQITASFTDLRGLTRLEMGGNGLGPISVQPSANGPGIDYFSSMTALSYLSFRNAVLSGTLPPAWSTLTRLTYLDMGLSQIMGSIPPELSLLTNLAALYVDQIVIGYGLTGKSGHTNQCL